MRQSILPLVLFATIVACPAHGAVRAVFENQDLIAPGQGEIAGLRSADLNNDGKADLAVLLRSYEGSRVFVYLGQGNGEFNVPVITPVSTAWRFDVGDLNGDGILDLAVAWTAGTYDNRIQTYHGAGDGSFTLAASKTVAHGCSVTTIALGDVTSDGRPDVLTCGLTVFPNLGSGILGNAIESAAAGRGEITVADANGDGRKDVFLGQATGLLLGNGDGTFAAVTSIDAMGPSAIADLDGNGRADVVFFDTSKHDVAVRLATMSGTYPTRTSAGFLTESREVSLAVGDLNADGRPDIVAGRNGHVSVYLANADFTPGPPAHYISASGCSQLAIADFDGDGKQDLVTAGAGDASDRPVVSIFRSAADGPLQGSTGRLLSTVADGGYFHGLDLVGASLSDVTGDGKLDAISVSEQYARIVVLPGNGDGSTAAPILTNLTDVAAWAQLLPVFADFDGDGRIDVAVGDVSGFRLHCWLSNGDGTFRQATSLSSVPLRASVPVRHGDFDGDGHQDLLLDAGNQIAYYPGAGDGTFAPPLVQANPWGQIALVGDLNNDGRDDVVFSNVQVALGSASRTFVPAPPDPFFGGGDTALVDLNADGNLDMIGSAFSSNTTTVIVRLGSGDGTFQRMHTLEADLRGAVFPIRPGVAGDFNADGKVDLLLHTTVLLGDGAGSFQGLVRFRYAGAPSVSAGGDVDGNGSTDILFVDESHSSMELVRTWGSDSRETPLTVALASSPASIEAGAATTVSATATRPSVFVPTGGVAFSVDNEVRALAEFVDGTAQGVIRTDAVGSRMLTAGFGGDDVYAAQPPASIAVEVTRATVNWWARRTTPEQPSTKDVVRVVGPLESALQTRPTGTVRVTVDETVLNGVAPNFDVNVGMLSLGPHTFSLDYEGDSLHLPYHYDWIVTVVKPKPQITLSITPSGSGNAGDPVKMTATFADAGITGTIQFYSSSTLLGTSPISGGVASLTISTLRVGSHFLYADYAGNDEYAPNYDLEYFTVVDRELPPSASSLWIVTPCRVLDTRGPSGPYGQPSVFSAETRALQVTGNCGVPFGARAVAINITAVQPTQIGFLTIFPGASSRSGTSTLNYRTGKTRANSAIVPLSAGGLLNIYNSGPNSQHVIVDVTGYFQ